MLTRDYYFDLPESLIAQVPVEHRGDEKLMYLNKRSG